MSTNLTMYNDQELPSLSLAWTDATGALIDFSSGWTFTVKLARSTAPATTLMTKTTGITGSSGSTGTNLTIAWSTTDWAGLEASVNGTQYVVHVIGRTGTNDRYFRPASPITLTLKAAPGTSAVSPSSYPITVDASTVTFTPSGSLTATNAQTAITEASTDLDAHIANTTGAHAASAISFIPSGSLVATNAQTAITEASTDLDAHIAKTSGAHAASAISFTPTGTIASTTVQAAIAEVATDAATDTVAGVVELATNAEALARTDTTRAVTPANLSQFLPVSVNSLLRSLPTAAIAQTVPRWAVNTTAGALLSTGRMNLYRIWLPAGLVSSITFVSGSAGATTPTNQWFALYDASRNKLAVTADDTTTAWGASSAKTLAISGGYTVPTEGDYYIGIMVAATTVPQLACSIGSGAVNALVPFPGGFDATNVGLTTPSTAPAVAAAITTSSGIGYAYVS